MEEYNRHWQNHKKDYFLDLPQTGVQSRLTLFRKDLEQKNTLHLGCSDWPDTEIKVKNKELLHQYLASFTKELYGMDYEVESVEIMKKNSIKNIFAGDIYHLDKNENFLNKKFDVLLVSEIIEHLVNPGLALESIKNYVSKTNPQCEVIFTVPNYHNFFFNFINGLRGREIVHYDHKFYFSYRTFRNLLEACGFEVRDFHFITYGNGINKLKGQILAKTILRPLRGLAPYLYFKCIIKKS